MKPSAQLRLQLGNQLTHSEFIDDAKIFLEKLFTQLLEKNIQLETQWNIDHLCYRVTTLARYEEQKNNFRQFATLLSEIEVHDRMISTFKLEDSLVFCDWQIDVVELPAPKPSKKTIEGFEHIEVVVDKPFSEIKTKYNECTFDESGLKKNFNQELEINLGTYSLKFHYLSLESVVRFEQNKKFFNAVKKMKILDDFRENSPIISGSCSLGIDINTSGVDILMCAKDLNAFKNTLTKKFGSELDFKIKNHVINGELSVVANFSFEDILFEVFAQHQHPVLQTANRHFLIQERLLKLGQEPLRKKIIALKQIGLDAESAFAKVLNLKGNSFDELLRIQSFSDLELKEILNLRN